MRHKLLRMLAFVLCVSMLFAFQIHAENPGDSGIMPLWDYAGGVNCDIFFTEFEVAIASAHIASRYLGGVVYGKITYKADNKCNYITYSRQNDVGFLYFSEKLSLGFIF